MEICGTHTHSVSRYGIRGSLPPNIRLLSGPGCPVCVTAQSDIDAIIEFSRMEKSVITATFGDMLRVPGRLSTLEKERALGSDIRIVYSPLGALDIARKNRRPVVLFSVGFETTAPTVAATIMKAKNEGLENFSVFSLHKLTPPAMRALLDSAAISLDGFLCPGHVTAVIGAAAYGFIADDYRRPCVVSGFEPLDILYSLHMLMSQIKEGRSEIEIEYRRVVTWEGNKKAQSVMHEVFEPADALWRGLDSIPLSGLEIRDGYAEFDAKKRFSIRQEKTGDSSGCSCAGVLKGTITPFQCALFANPCAPENPIGPCMVSAEGTCAAYYKYERGQGETPPG
jgi:hydrogenase expression/formation protein HypD